MRGMNPFQSLMVPIALICIGSPLASADVSQKSDSRVAYLRAHTVKIRSISPADRDFSDLEPLRAAIGSRRVVMLGEESHHDGATFLAKTRLIEFLHERMGFNVLAFESGFYDVHRAWYDLTSGVDPTEAIRSGIFGIWTNSRETEALWAYVAAQSRGSRPLVLAGIDSQFTGTASKRHFLTDLGSVLDALPPSAQIQEARACVFAVLRSYFALHGTGTDGLKAFQKQTGIADQARFYIAIEKLREALKGQSDGDAQKTARRDYWVQVLASTSLQFRHLWHEDLTDLDNPGPAFDWAAFNLRDRAMGENLVWLARNEFAGQKIIVWAATSHEMRHREFFTTEYTAYAPMGDWVDRAMGLEVYTIGFTAFNGNPGWEIGTAAPGSIENLIHETGAPYVFLDFRRLDAAGSWLTEPLSSWPLGYQAETTDWPATMDGLFYIQTMTPSTPVSGQSL